MSRPGSGGHERRNRGGVLGADEAHGFLHFLRRAEHQMIQPDRIHAELLGDLDHLVERVEALVRDGRVDADPQRRVLAAGRRLQPREPLAGPLERPLQAARDVVHLARTVNRDADVLEEPGRREIRQGLGPLLADDGPVRRQIAAGVALLAEEIQDGHDVLPHEDLAAGEVHLEPGTVGERLAQRVEGHLLAPLALDVQQVADVAELAVQVAPHRRFVDGAHREPIGATGPLLDEALDAALVQAATVPGPGVPRDRPRAGAHRDRLAPSGNGRTQRSTGRPVVLRVLRDVAGQGHRFAKSPAAKRCGTTSASGPSRE